MQNLSKALCISLSLAVWLAACSPAVPDNPTWAEDVAPILAANCVRCHTVPAIGGAPNGFRLDVYEDTVLDDGTTIRGAGTMAKNYIDVRIVDEEAPMPPQVVSLSDRQIEVLTNWAENRDADGRATRGGARSGNAAPEIAILAQTEQGDEVVIEYEITDADHDIVIGELSIDGPSGAAVITRELHSGRGQVVWDTGLVDSGMYQISASLSDPSGTVQRMNIASRMVDNANVAPTVTVLSPVRDSLIAVEDDAPPEIVLVVDDPDAGDTLTVTSITARLGEQTSDVSIADGDVTAGVEKRIPWDLSSPDNFPEGFSWHLEVTVSDGTNERTARTGPFILGRRSRADAGVFGDGTGDDIKALLGACTFCHPGPGADPFVPGLTHTFIDFNGTGDVLGAFELRGLIFRRAVQERNMPPVSSTATPLTDEQVQRLENWLLAGTPE